MFPDWKCGKCGKDQPGDGSRDIHDSLAICLPCAKKLGSKINRPEGIGAPTADPSELAPGEDHDELQTAVIAARLGE
jgi:hypothetical protein